MTDIPDMEPHMAHGEVIVTAANVRRRATPNGKIEGVWQKGQRLTVWEVKQGRWCLVMDMTTGINGWTHADYLAVQGELVRSSVINVEIGDIADGEAEGS